MSLKSQRVVLFGLTSSYSVLLLMLAVCVLSAPGQDQASEEHQGAGVDAAVAPEEFLDVCDAERPCGGEQVCYMGRCINLVGQGGDCSGVKCQAGLVCQDYVCSKPGEASVPLACTDEDVVNAMQFMIEECDSRPPLGRRDNLLKIEEFCTAADYAKLTLTDENFHILMRAFHRTMITVNLPAITNPRELRKNGGRIVTGIRNQLLPYKSALQEGAILVLVGRMGRDQVVSAKSREVTVSRTNLVERALRKVVGEGSSGEALNSRMFVLHPDKVIEPEHYKQHYAPRSIGWDDASTQIVQELETDAPDSGKVVARSVHIFIIPCTVAARERSTPA